MWYNIFVNIIGNIVSFAIYQKFCLGTFVVLILVAVLILREVKAMREKDRKSVRKFILKRLKEAKELKLLAFMGKDLVEVEFREAIKKFLQKANKAIFLIEDPNSNYIVQRANTLNRTPEDVKTGIQNTISQIQQDFQKGFPSKVELKKCDFLPIFKLYFIDDILIIGFYTKQTSYENSFLIVNSKSDLYDAMKKYFESVEKNCK